MTEDLPEEWPQEAKEDFRECNDCEKVENQGMSLGLTEMETGLIFESLRLLIGA